MLIPMFLLWGEEFESCFFQLRTKDRGSMPRKFYTYLKMYNLASYMILELQFTGSALKPIAFLSLLTA